MVFIVTVITTNIRLRWFVVSTVISIAMRYLLHARFRWFMVATVIATVIATAMKSYFILTQMVHDCHDCHSYCPGYEKAISYQIQMVHDFYRYYHSYEATAIAMAMRKLFHISFTWFMIATGITIAMRGLDTDGS